MGYNEKNNIRIYAEDATPEKDKLTGLTFDDATWKSLNDRTRGSITGTADSQVFNTALKQSSLLATILGEIIAQRYNTLVTTNLTSAGFTSYDLYISSLASKFTKENFLFDGEVKKKHLNTDILTGTLNDLTAGNVSKTINKKNITDIFETDGTTAKNSTNVKTNINGKAITDIFETDGVTVKKSVLATKLLDDSGTAQSQITLYTQNPNTNERKQIIFTY